MNSSDVNANTTAYIVVMIVVFILVIITTTIICVARGEPAFHRGHPLSVAVSLPRSCKVSAHAGCANLPPPCQLQGLETPSVVADPIFCQPFFLNPLERAALEVQLVNSRALWHGPGRRVFQQPAEGLHLLWSCKRYFVTSTTVFGCSSDADLVRVPVAAPWLRAPCPLLYRICFESSTRVRGFLQRDVSA